MRNRRDHATSATLVPPNMLLNFTLNGTVPLLYEYANENDVLLPSGENSGNNRSSSNDTTWVVGRRYFSKQQLVNILVEQLTMMREERFSAKHRRALQPQIVFLEMVSRLRVLTEGKEVLVVGSLDYPVIEVALLEGGGASRVFSVDYRPILTEFQNIIGYDPDEFWAFYSNDSEATSLGPEVVRPPSKFDVIVAYSSLHHDGLGRYGDAVDPFGDLHSMSELWSLLKVGGLLYLNVPVGNDCVLFNKFRVYGRRRLPLLLYGWEVVHVVHLRDGWFEDNQCEGTLQKSALFVLRKVRLEEYDMWMELCKVKGLLGPFPLYNRPR